MSDLTPGGVQPPITVPFVKMHKLFMKSAFSKPRSELIFKYLIFLKYSNIRRIPEIEYLVNRFDVILYLECFQSQYLFFNI